jgi:hypothetical protein
VSAGLLVQLELVQRLETSTLATLNLPAALNALEKPVGLPPSLLGKAEEVRSENGPQLVEKLIEDTETLSKQAQHLIDEVIRNTSPQILHTNSAVQYYRQWTSLMLKFPKMKPSGIVLRALSYCHRRRQILS